MVRSHFSVFQTKKIQLYASLQETLLFTVENDFGFFQSILEVRKYSGDLPLEKVLELCENRITKWVNSGFMYSYFDE